MKAKFRIPEIKIKQAKNKAGIITRISLKYLNQSKAGSNSRERWDTKIKNNSIVWLWLIGWADFSPIRYCAS